ncbi:MAG: hypothetical protein V3T79_00015 [Candidatus Scalindua sediminis]|jgi:hypothetical protein
MSNKKICVFASSPEAMDISLRLYDLKTPNLDKPEPNRFYQITNPKTQITNKLQYQMTKTNHMSTTHRRLASASLPKARHDL